MTLRLERDGAVATLLIDRPRQHNAMNQEMWERLPQLVQEAMADEAIRVLILTSAAPGLFCAGADIHEFARHSGEEDWRVANQAAIRATQYALAHAEKPVIAAIDGDAIGGGCGMAIACDLRIASPSARLGITPAKLGIVYSLFDTRLLVDLVGPARAKRILFTAALHDAEDALAIGLIDQIAPAPLETAVELARRMAANAQHSIRSSKAIVRRILDGQADDDAETLAMFRDAFTLPDFQEGVQAFRDKRRPRF
ncbi:MULTISPECIES: enoyl-CoA hydratase/isomerase family protein [Sphingobium]|jgi:enoyl-CoA hydratase/carnithine racemase|uniref:Enoyl-CoA hydratase n=1 Tax=Sphingobium fuliginis (strain ATCC 27551) TaxID=336203 RepID=A0A292ZI24_SPHSA|nr:MULTISPECIES: enoyl-CoA hydratase-related protein [Sphingobium]QOT71963.1 enoyl-CoA hydratase/isomerase family protein [Sphingobium fuliginis]RYL99269.1 enoyl-CoA hydratase/isomerase family protein [Sphingobium fuliginis]WDA36915.1 enoyl-CoA hydratase-related protein [Sphingobium sp. YC-XJ3]GAY23077.1 enoyl-CoA hydratase [Sphingobium fuliginis]GFZ83650.1 enoyl-CoA hydratase [Sphingobium fuliginis]